MVTLLLAAALAGPYTAHSAEFMTTRIDITLPSDRDDALPLVLDAFRHVESIFNEWRPESPIGQLNQHAGEGPQVVDGEVFALLERGVQLGRQTDGAYDITWAALWGVWDFRATAPKVPDAAAIAARLPRIGYAQVQLDPTTRAVTLPAGVSLGLGGMSKGYALDLAAASLRAHGVDSYWLSAGGQVIAGTREDRPWRVGIRDPRGDANDYFAVVELSGQSISTSGDYERFFIQDGKRYHHILDPRTGWPATGLRSASVISSDATQADALSTAILVLGKEQGLALAVRLGVEALVVDNQGQVAATTALAQRLQITHDPTP